MAFQIAGQRSWSLVSRKKAITSVWRLPNSVRPRNNRSFGSIAAPRRFSYQTLTRSFRVTLTVATALGLLYSLPGSSEGHAEIVSPAAEIAIDNLKRRKGVSKEEKRDIISSQHLQVKRSQEYPGVYAWGCNTARVAAPDSDEPHIKTPRRIPYFDDLLLRDIKLDSRSGAAVKENGDLVQWGLGYSTEVVQPTVTLKGKDLKEICISRDRIIGLSRSGSVYSIPVLQKEQEMGTKSSEGSWIPFWNYRSRISYRNLRPPNLGFTEKVRHISGGMDHAILLTDIGRVFSVASATHNFPSRGQLGVPGIAQPSHPDTPHDTCHEITTLRGFDVKKIASGDYHSLVLDKEGRVFSFGDNSCGQLGFEYSAEAPFVDAPSLLPIQRLYAGTYQSPKVTDIAAGGVNSFFMVDATRVAGPSETASKIRGLGKVTADTWTSGQGIKGTLGNGRWTHLQGKPVKVPSLSGLFEYDENTGKVIPIRMTQISVGSNHASAVMNNVTYLDASEKGSDTDTNWGADVLWWGGNEYYQLGTGKRNNISNPIYIRPLDLAAEAEVGRKEEHRFHITPRNTVNMKGRKVSMEQRVECGRNVTAVYSGV